MAHKILNISDMASTDVNSLQVTMTFATDVDRGAVVVPGALKANGAYSTIVDRENFVGGFVTTLASDMVCIVDYDGVADIAINGGLYRENLADPRNIYLPAGTPGRCRTLVTGDRFEIDAAWFESAPTVGQYVIPSTTVSGAWGASSATVPTTSRVYAKVLAATNFTVGNEYVPAYLLQIIQGN